MNKKLKDFNSFLNEEADIKKNTGLPSDFTRNAQEDARRNLGVVPDSGNDSTIRGLMNQSIKLLVSSIPFNQIEEKFTQMEELAKEVIMDEYKVVFEYLPIDLRVRYLRPDEKVIDKLPELMDKPVDSDERPDYSEDDEPNVDNQEDVQSQSQEISDEDQSEDQSQSEDDDDDPFSDLFKYDTPEEQEKSEEENLEEIIDDNVDKTTNKEVAKAIDKAQILNLITQGAGKSTKDIIKSSDKVADGMMRIIGPNSTKLIEIWGKISDEADKNDWRIPMGELKNNFKDHPIGMAGAVDVKFENFNFKFKGGTMIVESNNISKIIVRAYGVDFPMLIHEGVKGIYMAIQNGAIKKNPELAEEIKRATSSYKDEIDGFRYGPFALQMLRLFILKCKWGDRYPNMLERMFFYLSKDKEKGGHFTDEQFLDIMKSIFSVFDKKYVRDKLEFVVNDELFEKSIAKVEIEKLIKEECQFEEEMEEAERKSDLEKALGSSRGEEGEVSNDETQSEIDKLMKATAERENDLSNKTPREIQDMINDALDEMADAKTTEERKLIEDKIKMLSGYLPKEHAIIYLGELERINEMRIRR